MALLRRAEIWDQYVCNSGVRLAVVGNVIGAVGREALDGTDSVTVDFPASDQAVAVLETRKVLRLVFSDTFTEWRISSIREVNGVDGTTISVTADHPLQDMADAGVLYELSSAGFPRFEVSASKLTVTEAINTYVLPHLSTAGYGYFALGTIEPTELQDIVFRKATPLAALRIICDLYRDEETKRPAELVVRRNGTTNYLIDIVRQRGSSATTADIRYLKNLRKTDLTTDSERQTTVIQPFGSDLPDGTPSGIARVAFRLGTPTGLVYPITDPEDDSSPILFTDQLTGYYVVPWQMVGNLIPPPALNPLVEITASSPGSPSTVTLASDDGIYAGEVYELRLNSDGDFLREMPSATTITDRKVQALERGDILGVRNLTGNGWLRLWDTPTGPPNDWRYYPADDSDGLSQNTDPLYTQFGGKSVKIAATSSSGSLRGLISPVFYPAPQVGLQLHCVKVRVFFKEFSGAAWFFLNVKDGATGAIIKRLTLTPEDNGVEKGYVPTIGSWVDVSIINVDLIDYELQGAFIEVVAGAGYAGTVEGAVECYIDAVEVLQNVGEAPEGYVEYSGSNKLWKEGNRILATFTEPPEHYEIEVDDLTRFDGTLYPFDTLTLGAVLRLTDQTLNIRGTEVRLIELNQDYLHPRSTTLKVATRWEQFVELASPLGSRPGVTPALTPGLTPPPPPGTTPQPPTTGIAAITSVPLPILDGGDVSVLLAQPSAATDYGWARPWFDSTGFTHVRAVADIETAGASGAEIFAEFSADAGESYDEPGVGGAAVAVSIAAAGQFVSGWIALDPTAIGDRVWGMVPRGGDASASPAIKKAHLQFRPGVAPTPPPGVPPTDTDLPQDDWGSIIFDADTSGARFLALGYGDDDDVKPWPDEVAGRDLSTPATTGLPKFKPTGFTGGLPCVTWGGLTQLLQCENPTESLLSWTYYFVLENLDGGDFAKIWGDVFEPPSFGFELKFNDASVFGHVNVAFNGDNGSASGWDLTEPHIYRWVKTSGESNWRLFVDGVLKIEASANPQVCGSDLVSMMDSMGGLGHSGHVGRVVAYDRAHNAPTAGGSAANGLTGPELALQAYWGTP